MCASLGAAAYLICLCPICRRNVDPLLALSPVASAMPSHDFRCIVSRALYDKRISQEVEGEALGDEFAGYVSAECFLSALIC